MKEKEKGEKEGRRVTEIPWSHLPTVYPEMLSSSEEPSIPNLALPPY